MLVQLILFCFFGLTLNIESLDLGIKLTGMFLTRDPLYQVFPVIFLMIWWHLSPVESHHVNFGSGKW